MPSSVTEILAFHEIQYICRLPFQKCIKLTPNIGYKNSCFIFFLMPNPQCLGFAADKTLTFGSFYSRPCNSITVALASGQGQKICEDYFKQPVVAVDIVFDLHDQLEVKPLTPLSARYCLLQDDWNLLVIFHLSNAFLVIFTNFLDVSKIKRFVHIPPSFDDPGPTP